MFNVIVAGCGGISGRWLDYSTRRDDVYIVALVDPVLENAYAHKKITGWIAPYSQHWTRQSKRLMQTCCSI